MIFSRPASVSREKSTARKDTAEELCGVCVCAAVVFIAAGGALSCDSHAVDDRLYVVHRVCWCKYSMHASSQPPLKPSLEGFNVTVVLE